MSTEGKNINWKFIPPKSPHFGDIWESNIKIVKLHLTKTIGQAILTFEEFYTLLTQIESVINSRPISPPLSSDPHDLNPLTPAHFLSGRPLNIAPDNDYSLTADNRLSIFNECNSFGSDGT